MQYTFKSTQFDLETCQKDLISSLCKQYGNWIILNLPDDPILWPGNWSVSKDTFAIMKKSIEVDATTIETPVVGYLWGFNIILDPSIPTGQIIFTLEIPE